MRSSVTLLVMVMLLGPTSAPAQSKTAAKEAAFGFHKGMTLKQAKSVAVLKPFERQVNVYYTLNPPRPFGGLVAYLVTISPTAGVCRVMAITKAVPPSDLAVKAAVVSIIDALTEKYGRSGPTPQSEDKSTLRVWMNPLGPNTAIKLTMMADAEGSEAAAVNYFFSNYEACYAEEMQGL